MCPRTRPRPARPASRSRIAGSSRTASSTHASRADVHFASPGSIVRSTLAGPVKRIRLDVTEGPAHRAAPRVRAGLDDIGAVRTAGLLREKTGHGIVPEDSPGSELGIVDPQR